MVDAAQLMDPRVPLVRHDEPCRRCAQLLGPSGYLIVVDGEGRYVGVLSERTLTAADPSLTASEVAARSSTVEPGARSSVPLRALPDSPSECVVVLDAEQRPLGLITVADAVQMARFVLPPPWRVRELMGRLLGRYSTPQHAYRVEIDDEAREGADALALAGEPVPVFGGSDNQPVGMVSALDVVDALAELLAPTNAVFVDPVP